MPSTLSKWYAGLPRHRRVRGFVGFTGVRRLQARKLLGVNRIPVTLVRRTDGLRVRIGADPLDEEIADSVTRRHRSVYFPPEFDDLGPRLVVDVGAHHGFYTLGALFEYPGSQVIALEPASDAVRVLRSNIELNRCNDRVRIEQQAIGTGHEAMRLHLDAKGSWGHSLIHVDNEGGTELVRQTPLVEILGDRVPDVIKCNAEGGESALIEGLADLAGLPPAMVLMIHPQLLDAPELLSKTRSLGYRCREAVEGTHPVWICTL